MIPFNPSFYNQVILIFTPCEGKNLEMILLDDNSEGQILILMSDFKVQGFCTEYFACANNLPEVKFGVRIPVSGPLASTKAIEGIARRAEELGYDSIWVHDHISWTREAHEHHISSGSSDALVQNSDPTFFESISTLSYLAGLTKSIKLGVACMVLPCRNPIYLAKQSANLDVLSKGRLILGAGLGSRTTRLSKEFQVFDVPVKTRGERFDEYANAMKLLWTGEQTQFSGKYINFKDFEMYPKPVQKPHPPLWVGGWSEGSAIRASRVGDGWIPGWLTPMEMGERVKLIQMLHRESHRDFEKFTVAVEKYLCVAKESSTAVGMALRTISQSRDTYERTIQQIDFAKDVHVFGSAPEVQSKIQNFVEAGVKHFEFKFIYSSVDELYEMMEYFASEVMCKYK